MIASLLLLPIFASNKNKIKMGDNNKFIAITFFVCCCYFALNINKKTKEKDNAHCYCLLLLKQKKKQNIEKKNAKKGESLPFFSYFYVWDEMLLLPFYSPHSFNIKLLTFLKPCVSCFL
jgi:hypothetical protein